MSEPRFAVFQGRDGQWYWHVVAGNGQVIGSSEAYTRRRDAERAARAFKVSVYRAKIA